MQYQGQSFPLDIRVRDLNSGQVLNTNVIISIDGVRINVSEGGAVGGTFGARSDLNIRSEQQSSSSSSSSTQNIIGSRAVTSLYENYEGLPAGATVSSQSVSYVSPAGQPRIPNPAPEIIRTAQA